MLSYVYITRVYNFVFAITAILDKKCTRARYKSVFHARSPSDVNRLVSFFFFFHSFTLDTTSRVVLRANLKTLRLDRNFKQASPALR